MYDDVQGFVVFAVSGFLVMTGDTAKATYYKGFIRVLWELRFRVYGPCR